MINKTALIIGGSRGLGKEMALRMAGAGHNVVLTYVSQKEAAEAVVKEIEAMEKQAVALRFDANDIASIDEFVN